MPLHDFYLINPATTAFSLSYSASITGHCLLIQILGTCHKNIVLFRRSGIYLKPWTRFQKVYDPQFTPYNIISSSDTNLPSPDSFSHRLVLARPTTFPNILLLTSPPLTIVTGSLRLASTQGSVNELLPSWPGLALASHHARRTKGRP